jgi:molybdate transport system substrate-binding protein
MRRWTLFAALPLICMVTSADRASATEIKVLSPGAVGSSLRELVPQFEQASGHKVTVTYSPALALVDRLEKGEATDVAIFGDPAAESLQKNGIIVSGSAKVVATVGVGVFVRRGDPKPNITTRDAFERSLLSARIITYSDPKLGGTAANYVGKLMAELDITGSVGPKTHLTPPAKPLADFVASGGASFGLTQITEILQDPRLELVGPLPAEIQFYTRYAIGIVAASRNRDVGKALIDFLASPAAGAVMQSKGFEPR